MPRPDAPVRVVNSGFDIGSNEVLTAMLDISPTSSGTYVDDAVIYARSPDDVF